MAPPELAVARIRRFCRTRVPPEFCEELRLDMTVRGNFVTLWESRASTTEGVGEWTRMRVAQLRWLPGAARWALYWTDSRNRWHPYDDRGVTLDLDKALKLIDADPLGAFFG